MLKRQTASNLLQVFEVLLVDKSGSITRVNFCWITSYLPLGVTQRACDEVSASCLIGALSHGAKVVEGEVVLVRALEVGDELQAQFLE